MVFHHQTCQLTHPRRAGHAFESETRATRLVAEKRARTQCRSKAKIGLIARVGCASVTGARVLKMLLRAFKRSKNLLGLYPGSPLKRGRGGQTGEMKERP
jgi:hypothetical protein